MRYNINHFKRKSIIETGVQKKIHRNKKAASILQQAQIDVFIHCMNTSKIRIYYFYSTNNNLISRIINNYKIHQDTKAHSRNFSPFCSSFHLISILSQKRGQTNKFTILIVIVFT